MEIPLGDTYYTKFTTRNSSGVPTALAGTPVISVYEEGNLTQITAGVTLTVDYDSVTGLNDVAIVATGGNGYEAGKYYSVVITTGTVDSNSVVGEVVDQFRIVPAENNAGEKVVDVASIGGTAQTANDVGADVNSILDDTGTAGVIISSSTIDQIADAVLDEALSGHLSAGSLGASVAVLNSGTAQGGSGTTIQLQASGPSAVDDFYNNAYVVIIDGTGAGQARFITDYVGSTKTATVDTWITNPSSDSVYVIKPFYSLPGASAPTAAQVADAVWDEPVADHQTEGSYGSHIGYSVLHEGEAQAGGASSITLDATGSSSTDDTYNFNIIRIVDGTGAGQSRQISDYVGSSKVATVSLAWTTQPSIGTRYQIIALGVDAATVDSIADGVWDEQRSGHTTAGSFGQYTNANVTLISDDATAATNLESYCDGTTPMPVNATQISGDATAADNLEAALDGTGSVTLTADITGNLSGSVGSVTGAVGSVTGAVASVTGAVGSVTGNVGGNVVGTVGELAAQAKADVNAEMVDVLTVDSVTQPGQGTPAANEDLATMVAYLYKAWRNRSTQTASEYALYNDDATTVDQKSAVSDNGTTFDKGEVATGP